MIDTIRRFAAFATARITDALAVLLGQGQSHELVPLRIRVEPQGKTRLGHPKGQMHRR